MLYEVWNDEGTSLYVWVPENLSQHAREICVTCAYDDMSVKRQVVENPTAQQIAEGKENFSDFYGA